MTSDLITLILTRYKVFLVIKYILIEIILLEVSSTNYKEYIRSI